MVVAVGENVICMHIMVNVLRKIVLVKDGCSYRVLPQTRINYIKEALDLLSWLSRLLFFSILPFSPREQRDLQVNHSGPTVGKNQETINV